jgi:hypothetical protein
VITAHFRVLFLDSPGIIGRELKKPWQVSQHYSQDSGCLWVEVGHIKLEAFMVTESNKRLLDVHQCRITIEV